MTPFAKASKSAISNKAFLLKKALTDNIDGQSYSAEKCLSEINELIDSVVEQERVYNLGVVALKLQEVRFILVGVQNSSDGYKKALKNVENAELLIAEGGSNNKSLAVMDMRSVWPLIKGVESQFKMREEDQREIGEAMEFAADLIVRNSLNNKDVRREYERHARSLMVCIGN